MDFTPEHLAKEAERLLHDEILNKAVADVRAEAIQQLCDCPATDTNKIMEHQQTVKVCNEIMLTLARFIEEWSPPSNDDRQPVYTDTAE